MNRTILHLDMNSYFASVEQQLNLSLRGKPVGVIKAVGRTCIIAASIEAKKYGIKTGMSTWEAKKLCPQVIFVPSQFNHYAEVTRKIIRLAYDYSPDIEVFSIDEMFLDITDTQTLWSGGSLEMALEIKKRIKLEIGDWLSCSIGVGWSWLSAKTASEMQKPDGLTYLTPINYLLLTNNLPVSEICGIGRSRAKYLESRGAFTLKQARALPYLPSEIYDLIFLRSNDELITNNDNSKSVSRTFTTYQTTSHKSQVTSLIRNLIEEVCLKLRDINMGGRTICLSLDSYHFRKTLTASINDPEIVFNLIPRDIPEEIRFAGISISNLVISNQLPVISNRKNLFRAVDKINHRHGLFTVYPARLMGMELIRPEVNGFTSFFGQV